MRSIVTGGSGFIGRHLAVLLRACGHRVLTLDRVERDGFHISGDINEARITDFARAFDPQVIYHLAALPGVGGAVNATRDAEILHDNLLSTVAMLQVAADTGAKFVFASSGAIYSLPESRHRPLDAPHRSSYAISKMAGEEYVRLYHQTHGIEYAICRFSNVYGPQRVHKAVMGAFFDALIAGEAPVINGTGEQCRDFLFVLDLVRKLFSLGNTDESGTYDICTGVRTSVLDFAHAVAYVGRIHGLGPLDPVFNADAPTGPSEPGAPPSFPGPWTPLRSGLEDALAYTLER